MGDWESIFKESGKVFYEPFEDVKNLLSLLKKKGVKKVLDLGCGSGRHTILLAKEGFEVYASDVSKSGLKLTKEWLKKEGLSAKTKQHSCYEKFPYKDNFFDAIISTQVIHHNYHDKVKFCISEIKRVLKPNKIIFITVAAGKKWGSLKGKLIAPQTYIPLDGSEKGLPHFIYTKTTIKEDFKDFKIINLYKKESHLCLLGIKI